MIGLPLMVLDITEVHLAVVRAPRYGYGKNMNPCIDCHTLMLKIAGEKMREMGYDFIFTGEVLGQRPMSQSRQMLHVVAKNSGWADHILRPLSARLLPETLAGEGRQGGPGAAPRHLGPGPEAADGDGRALRDHGIFQPGRGMPADGPHVLEASQKPLHQSTRIHAAGPGAFESGAAHPARRSAQGHRRERSKRDNQSLEPLIEDRDAVLQMRDFPGPLCMLPGGRFRRRWRGRRRPSAQPMETPRRTRAR